MTMCSEQVTVEALTQYPDDEDKQEAFKAGVAFAQNNPDVLLNRDRQDCPQCDSPMMRDEWEHSEPGWECVQCNYWLPDSANKWSVEDCMGEIQLCCDDGDKTATIEYRINEDEPWSQIFLTRSQVMQLARVATVISQQLADAGHIDNQQQT